MRQEWKVGSHVLLLGSVIGSGTEASYQPLLLSCGGSNVSDDEEPDDVEVEYPLSRRT